jgi:glycosyltransferase involved in cell wall biosynthesis
VVALNVHALPPLSPHDVWLSSENSTDYDYAWSRVITRPERHHHPYRIKEKRGAGPVLRESLGIAGKAIIWLTVGGRLATEIVDPWAASMGKLLKEHQDVVWVLVGTEGSLIASIKTMPPNQIKALGRRDDVPGLLQMSDVYVNPPRLGGGFSVAESMSAALPVVSFAHSDGGDKIGPHAVKNMDEYLSLLSQLTASQSFRCEMGGLQRDMFKARIDLANSGPSLMSAFEKADQLARRRIKSLP